MSNRNSEHFPVFTYFTCVFLTAIARRLLAISSSILARRVLCPSPKVNARSVCVCLQIHDCMFDVAQALSYQQTDPKTGQPVTVYGTWTEQQPWGVAPPDCRENQITRDNHHGNALG